MTDDPTARTARGNPRPTRATRSARRRRHSQREVTLLVGSHLSNTTPFDEVAVSVLLEFLAMWTRITIVPRPRTTPD